MSLPPKSMQQLKELIPNYSEELKPEYEKELANIDVYYRSNGTKTFYKKFWSVSAKFLIEYPALLLEGYSVNTAKSKIQPGVISIVFNKSHSMIEEEKEQAKSEAKEKYNLLVLQAQEEWIDTELKELEELKVEEIKAAEATKAEATKKELLLSMFG